MKLVKSRVAEPGSSQYSRNFFLVLKRYKFFIVILRLLFSTTNNKEYLKKNLTWQHLINEIVYNKSLFIVLISFHLRHSTANGTDPLLSLLLLSKFVT